ncbi:MAG: SEC-C domain-containing protein [Chlamydiia bacterium]|nr:SEC-C domain-containing protein [Chlamydiia bacterium]
MFFVARIEGLKNEISIFMKRPGRNDPCHCGSGKKFKKCCESKMMRGRFLAAPLSEVPAASLQGRAIHLFQSRVLAPQPSPTAEALSAVQVTQPLESKGDVLVSSQG